MCSPPSPRAPSRTAAAPDAPHPLAKTLRPSRARRAKEGQDTLANLRIPVTSRANVAVAT